MAVEAQPTAQRRVSLTRRLLRERRDAGELLVHALAQLPDSVVLDLPSDLRGRKAVELLAAAYGISARVSFRNNPFDETLSSSSVVLERQLRDRRPLGEFVETLTLTSDSPASIRVEDAVFADQRIAVVTNLPAHYRAPLFTKMAARLTAAGASLRVFFLAPPPTSRPWMKPGKLGFEHEFLRGVDMSRDRGRHVLPLSLERRLAVFAPTLVLTGGFSPAVSVRVARYARRAGVPFGIWSGEIASRPTAKSRLRAVGRRWIANRADFAIAYGSRSADYLRSLRQDLPIVLGRNTTLVASPRAAVERRALIEVLTVGRAEAGKALEVTIDAARRVPGCRLTVIGGGPALRELKVRAGGDPRVRFLGALSPEDVAQAYADADIFLFPSRYDVFGLVLVEAMSAGLASIVSTAAGAVDDLCVPDANSLVVGSADPARWAEALSKLVEDSELRVTLGFGAQRTIRNRWTLEHAADAMLAGFRLGILQHAHGASDD
jgi:glycosyltransferase involved in cell wall biosynthesis